MICMSRPQRIVTVFMLALLLGTAGCGGSAPQAVVREYIGAVAAGDWPAAYDRAYAGPVAGADPDLDAYRLAAESAGLDELCRGKVTFGRTVRGAGQARVPVQFRLPDGRRFEGCFELCDRAGYWTLVSGFPEVTGVRPNGVTGEGYGQYWHIRAAHYARPAPDNRKWTELGTVYEIISLENSIYSYVWRASSGLSSASGQFTADAPVTVMEPIRFDQADVSPTRFSPQDLRRALENAVVTIRWRGYEGLERYEELKIDPASLREEYVKPIHGW